MLPSMDMDAAQERITFLEGEVADLRRRLDSARRLATHTPEQAGMVVKQAARRRSFGWAYVAKRKDGTMAVDISGDFVTDPDVVEEAAYGFVTKGRGSDVFHDGKPVGRMIESLALTPDKVERMGATGVLPQVAHWVGFEWEPEVWPRIESGELGAFSWGGRGRRRPVR